MQDGTQKVKFNIPSQDHPKNRSLINKQISINSCLFNAINERGSDQLSSDYNPIY
jgi:hypothetical protein